MKEKILELRSQGKSYKQIASSLNCSLGIIAYHCGVGQKAKTRARESKRRGQHPLVRRTEGFRQRCKDFTRGNGNSPRVGSSFTWKEAALHIGDNPSCYLTGRKIDLSDGGSYQLDHITPRSKNGTSDLDNMAVACSEANFAKGNLSREEFLNLCKEVLIHHGYEVHLGQKH